MRSWQPCFRIKENLQTFFECLMRKNTKYVRSLSRRNLRYFTHLWNCDSSTGYSVLEIGKRVIAFGDVVLQFYMCVKISGKQLGFVKPSFQHILFKYDSHHLAWIRYDGISRINLRPSARNCVTRPTIYQTHAICTIFRDQSLLAVVAVSTCRLPGIPIWISQKWIQRKTMNTSAKYWISPSLNPKNHVFKLFVTNLSVRRVWLTW